eukprot:CAMPEP_0177371334 /NCGR_PEP_ID=MMETSP0368-20130122/42464_1 /TAXON_ID=447022 ORGANISM="Scrippsiella hangoei-like, Strain SHHI-4" /NCGR_SAMPLE_ID=MMETSP0368 /ASSEMBLY_ACC=CAM_ASM_000363 /LENGTH=189 /DNA_ID=CAMNT_0018834647 /DNA_START=353 /DNA_END=922 /DNA_ORIENTATION=+
MISDGDTIRIDLRLVIPAAFQPPTTGVVREGAELAKCSLRLRVQRNPHQLLQSLTHGCRRVEALGLALADPPCALCEPLRARGGTFFVGKNRVQQHHPLDVCKRRRGLCQRHQRAVADERVSYASVDGPAVLCRNACGEALEITSKLLPMIGRRPQCRCIGVAVSPEVNSYCVDLLRQSLNHGHPRARA